MGYVIGASKFKQYKQVIFISLILLAALAGFQNCSSDVKFASSESLSSGFSSLDGQLKINDGATYTNDIKVRLNILTNLVTSGEMAVSNTQCLTETDLQGASHWQSFKNQSEWILDGADGTKQVYLYLRSSEGQISDCIGATISLDSVSPTLNLIEVPHKFTKDVFANFIVDAQDGLSGIDKIYCNSSDGSSFSICPEQTNLNDLSEGSHTLSFYAKDRAGNTSGTISHSWFVDLTPPTVQINAPMPSAIEYVNTVSLHFSGSDTSGSGIESYKCSLNDNVYETCSSPVNLSNLNDGAYVFNVMAVDKVGWESEVAKANFIVDTKPSGEFVITGLTGGLDVTIDGYLTDLSVPTVNFSESMGAQSYQISILNQAKDKVICGPLSVSVTQAVFSSANCKLSNGGKYWARAVAIRNSIPKNTSDFSFLVDVKGPDISIVKHVSNDELKTASVDFNIVDSESGIKSAICKKTYKEDVQEIDCKNLTSVDYSNLPDGDHVFTISAMDNAGHASASMPVTLSVRAIVCNPFNPSTLGECKKGLKANLYYASEADRASDPRTKFNTVGKLIEFGLKSNTLIYLPNVDVSLRSFTEGFTTNSGQLLADDKGNKLEEWFALEMTSTLKLSETDIEGYYQVIVISDDGSNFYTDVNADGVYNQIIDNDGQHTNQVGCPASGQEIYMKKDTLLPIKIEYYQGPRTEIGFTVLWRKVTNKNSALSSFCGYSNYDQNIWNKVNGTYDQIKSEGFSIPTPENYISD